MGIMTERSSLIQQAFQDEPLRPADRERLWSTMQHRTTRQARWRNLMLAAVLILAGAIVAGALVVRNAIRSTSSSTDRGALGPIVVAADSISSVSPSEVSVIQETRQEVPSNLIPLLGHRSGLAIDLSNLSARREQLLVRLKETTGAEHAAVSTELSNVEHQLEATRVAIEVIDRQLAGHREPVVYEGSTTIVEPPQFINIPGMFPSQMIWLTGGAGALLVLGMVAMLGYMRRLSRTLKESLSLIEGQVSSQHATLASGIDAIAVEVERLGEGQRFMSKVLASDPRTEIRS
jgi:hypothetical protein